MSFDSVFSSFICTDCNVSQPTNQLVEFSDKNVCETCIENYPVCNGCEDHYQYSYELTRVNDNSLVLCSDCLDSHYTKCDCCETFVSNDIITTTGNSQSVCDDCLEVSYSICDYYQEYYPSEDMVLTGNIRRGLMPSYSYHTRGTESFYVCQDAIDRHFTYCHDCNEYYHDDMMTSVNGSSVCESCYEDNYFSCEECDDHFSNDQLNYDHNDRRVCNRCLEESEPSTSADPSKYCKHIRSYHKIAVDRELGFFGKPVDKLFYGIELETRSGTPDNLVHNAQTIMNDPDLKRFMMLFEDGSLSKDDDNECNFEIVTAPATLDEHKKYWNIFFSKKFRGLNSWKTGTCGIHIHVSRKALTALQIGKLIVFINDRVNRDFITAIAGRYDTGYSKIKNKKLS